MSRRAVVLAVATLAASLIPTARAEAVPAPRHCVNHVVGQRADGELILSADRCYATFEGAMRAEGVSEWGVGAAQRAATAGGARLLLFTLAIHYDLANFNGAGGSTSTVGSSCGGGYTNLSAAWNNRISSTANGCPTVRHHDSFNLGGSSESTTGFGGNLTALNDITSSVQYL